MSKSNWNDSSGWKTIDDPTGVLDGRVLVVTAGACSSAEDYLTQYVGTAETFSKANYKVCAYYAFPSNTTDFVGGKLGLIARAGSLSGSPQTAQDLYIGLIDNEAKKIKIVKRSNDVETVLASADMPTFAVSTGYRHKLELQCYGSSIVTLRMLIDDRLVINISDNTTSAILTGYPGMYIYAGTSYVDTFIIHEYTSNGLAPADWEPNNAVTSLAVWLKHNTGLTVTGSDTISAWADQSGNSNNASQGTAAFQPDAVSGQGISEGTVIKFVSGSGTEKHLTISDAASIDLNATGVTIFAFVRPLTYGSSLGGSTINIGNVVNKESTYSLATSDDTAGSPTTTKSLRSELNTTVYSANNAVENLDTWYIVGMVSDRLAAANTAINGFFINGTYSANTTSLGANNANVMTIGAYDNGSGTVGNLLNGYLTEVVVYGGEITTADRQKTEGYLAHKFGSQSILPLDHPYRTVKPTV